MTLDQWLKARAQSPVVLKREAHARYVLKKYHERRRSRSCPASSASR